MKKGLIYIFVVLLGLSLLGFSAYLKGKGAGILYWTAKVDEQCKSFNLNCTALSSILGELHNSGVGVSRTKISKDDLPIVRIYMNDGALEKLDSKREAVLAKPRPIHIVEKKDWVKAKIQVEYSDRKEKSAVSIRLKGDWGDHLQDPKKLSFRIKTVSGGYLFGMKVLSIQHPKTRRYGNEPLLLKQMRAHDILAPRYRFVDVFLNDFPIGIMAVEEHFSKEMIEAQNRRDGPLLAVNEDPLWQQWDINYNSEPPIGEGRFNFSGHRDSMIKNFNDSKFIRGSIPTNNVIRGQALLRDFYDGRLSAREAFDYEKLSKYWILVNIWGGCHSSIWHNRRFYFNPISGLLEPVGFDNIPHPESFKSCKDVDIKASLQDPQFLSQVAISAKEIYRELKSPVFMKQLADDQKRQAEIFEYEDFKALPISVTSEMLIKNLQSLMKEISRDFSEYGNYDFAFMPQPTKVIGSQFLKDQPNIALHMSSFYYPSERGGDFEFRNLTLEPINVVELFIPRKKGKKDPIDVEKFYVPAGSSGSGLVKFSYLITAEVLAKHAEFAVKYEYKGKLYTRPVFVQFKNSPSGYASDPIATLRKVNGHKWIDIIGKKVVFAKGPHDFTQSLALPKGWSLDIQAGAELNFRQGTLLKVQGPLNVKGTKEQPVVINVESDLTFKDMGSWGGVLVSKSNERSLVKHLILKGNGVQNLNTRQGFYGMTGCLSFYESDVTITHSSFIDAQCEDALNIVKADFTMDNVLIHGARADAFDSDFSTGSIMNSKFIASGNDGVDVSGTTLELTNITMNQIGDKAVSVGEKSTLAANGIDINGAVLGLVSKDLSEVMAKNIAFENISGTAIMTYIKKAEYGASTLECENCKFNGDMSLTGAQAGTKITLNGQKIFGGSLTKKQMIDSGLIEQGS